MRRGRASSRSATSRATKRTGSREAADRERREHRGVGARRRSRTRGSRASRARVRGDARPDLDAPCSAERRVRLRRLLGAHPHHARRERGREPVPLAGGAGREDHVGPVAGLDDVADQPPLVRLEQLPRGVEHRHDRHRQPAPRSGVLERSANASGSSGRRERRLGAGGLASQPLRLRTRRAPKVRPARARWMRVTGGRPGASSVIQAGSSIRPPDGGPSR